MIQFTPYRIPSMKSLNQLLEQIDSMFAADENAIARFGGYLIKHTAATFLVHSPDWLETLVVVTNFRIIVLWKQNNQFQKSVCDRSEIMNVSVSRVNASENAFKISLDLPSENHTIATISNSSEFSFNTKIRNLFADEMCVSGVNIQFDIDEPTTKLLQIERRKLNVFVVAIFLGLNLLYWGLELFAEAKLFIILVAFMFQFPIFLVGMFNPNITQFIGKNKDSTTTMEKVFGAFLFVLGIIATIVFVKFRFSYVNW